MTELSIRKAFPDDTDSLINLWNTVFGDPPEFVRKFLLALADCGYAAVAVQDGEVLSMTVVIRGIYYNDTPCSYLYAVATHPLHRGRKLASRVLQFCKEEEKRSLDGILLTAPAEPDLFQWYRSTIHADHTLTCSSKTVLVKHTEHLLPTEKLDVRGYGSLRDEILQGKPHLYLSDAYLHLVDILCSYYGGGLYRIGDSIAAVYPDGEILQGQEVLTCHDSEQAVIQTLLQHFHCSAADYRTIGSEKPYLSSDFSFQNQEWLGLIMD